MVDIIVFLSGYVTDYSVTVDSWFVKQEGIFWFRYRTAVNTERQSDISMDE